MPKPQIDFFLFLGLLSLFIVPFLLFNFNKAPFNSPPFLTSNMATMYTQTPVTLPLLGRGSHLITQHITSSVSDIGKVKCGLLHLFLQHTSCALTMNENWDEDVRKDMSDSLDRLAPEDKKGQGLYRHDAEGSDDMPVSRRLETLLLGIRSLIGLPQRLTSSLLSLEPVLAYQSPTAD